MVFSNWTLPAPEPVPFGLLAASRPIGADWTRGITFLSGQCLTPGLFGPCEIAAVDPEGPSAVARFDPYDLRQGVVCSTLSGIDLEKLATQALDVRAEYLLGFALEDNAAANTNPALSDGTNLGALGTVAEGVSCLDRYLGLNLYGEEGVVHMNPGFLSLLGDAIYKDGDVYRTAGGHRIAASPGYQAADLFYATGPVFAATRPDGSRVAVDRTVNTSEGYADEVGIVAFDPCLNVNVTVPELCAFTSP